MTARSYDATAVQALLAHRHPFILVDRIDVIVPGQHVTGRKVISAGEWWADAESPAEFPFMLVVEALAQTSGALIEELAAELQGAVAYFMSADRVRFRRAARIGDELRLDVALRQWRRGICRTRGVATLADGSLVATADLATVVRGDA
jgi:3-hydroxyacyl-[acyl-carrier-protein] dehydratase